MLSYYDILRINNYGKYYVFCRSTVVTPYGSRRRAAGNICKIFTNRRPLQPPCRTLLCNGQTAVAVYAVLMYASDLCWPLLYGIADSLAPALGYNWGAKNYSRVKSIAKRAYIGTAIVGFVSTSLLFFLPGTIASWFVKAEDIKLLEISTHAIRLFCFAYLFRWIAVTTQSYFTAIEKPLQATIMSVAVAFVFPVVLLGAFWSFGLDGIWFNFVGVNALAAALSVFLLVRLMKEIKKKELLQEQP